MARIISVDQRDLLAGVLVAVVGGIFFFGARDLPEGAPGRIGPGFVPSAVSLIAIGIGLAIAVKAFGRSGAIPRFEIRPVLSVFASVAVFGLLIRSTGLAPALIGTTLVAAIGSYWSRVLHVIALALSVALGCSLIFIVLLGLPFDAYRSPF